ncbi:MAG: spore photoproduct lyase family protein [Thermodesulfobacteriota bacterium]
MRFPIDEIWIDEDAVDEPVVREVVRRLPGSAILTGDAAREAAAALANLSDPFSKGKRVLRLMRHRGEFVKPCPGTRGYVCCGLDILHIGQGCPMDCRYCALQAYFNRPVLELFVNIDGMLADLRGYLTRHPKKFHRICTGEFTDSLALDPLSGLAARLVELFSEVENASLEFKTKTDFIGPLLDLNPTGRIVLSWSVNSGLISGSEEKGATALTGRLAAAAKAVEKGYLVGFHFDPIIPHPVWSEHYLRTVDRVFRTVDSSRIAWISLGVLRFVARLKEIVRTRHGPVRYFHDGFITGLDGKSRIPVDRRIAIYRVIVDRIRQHHANARVYLCMESAHVWKEALGIDMDSDEALGAYLEAAFP